MPKKKVIVEGLVDYLFDKDKYKGRIQVHSFFTVEAEYSTYAALGNETWTWAQSHWPDFIAMEGPTLIIDEVEIPTTLRWCCVTGVKGLSNNDLPFVKEYGKEAKTTPKNFGKKYSIQDKSKDKVPPRKAPVAVPEPTKEPEVFDFEEYKAKKIKKALEE